MSRETSIVVRAFNEARHLPRLIEGIAAQTHTDYETILVDSGSTDETTEIARGAFDRIVSIEPGDFTFGYSLNRGLADASGRYVVIVSAHTYPADKHWLERLLCNFEDEQVALVYGNQLPVEVTKFSERREFEQLFGAARRVQRPPDYYCNNANSAIRRELWEQHPYDEALTGVEDQGWAKHWMDRGYVIVYEPEAAIHHIHEESWEQIQRRYYREAFARRRLGLDRRRNVPRKIARGARELLGDVRALRVEGAIDRRSLLQVVRYRARQTRGDVRGLIHDYNPVLEHHDLFFDRGDMAVTIGGPGDAALRQRPLPEVKPNDVLIRVAYVGVCATDLEVLEGRLGYYRDGAASYPIVPGHEYSGVIVKKGANAGDELSVGDRVVGACILGCMRCPACEAGNPIACDRRREVGVMNHDGAYAEHVVLPSEHVHRIGADADLVAHALVEPLAVAHKGISRLVLDGEARHCAVVGAGPIGNLAAQVLARAGHAVTVFDLDAARLEQLPAGIAGSERVAGLERFDVVVEATGSREALEASLAQLGTGVQVLLLGLPYGELPVDFERIVAYDRAVIGSVGSGPADFRAAIGLVPELELGPFTRAVFPLERFEDAWEAQRSRSALKVMLEVRP